MVMESFKTNKNHNAKNKEIENRGVCEQNQYLREKKPIVPQGKRKVEVLGSRHSGRMSLGVGGDHYKQVSAKEL
jgi:hypothetical protein